MIQSTLGISRPRAATSVQSRIPVGALQNSKNVLVRFCCFCFPYTSALISSVAASQYSREDLGQEHQCNSTIPHGISLNYNLKRRRWLSFSSSSSRMWKATWIAGRNHRRRSLVRAYRLLRLLWTNRHWYIEVRGGERFGRDQWLL